LLLNTDAPIKPPARAYRAPALSATFPSKRDSKTTTRPPLAYTAPPRPASARFCRKKQSSKMMNPLPAVRAYTAPPSPPPTAALFANEHRENVTLCATPSVTESAAVVPATAARAAASSSAVRSRSSFTTKTAPPYARTMPSASATPGTEGRGVAGRFGARAESGANAPPRNAQSRNDALPPGRTCTMPPRRPPPFSRVMSDIITPPTSETTRNVFFLASTTHAPSDTPSDAVDGASTAAPSSATSPRAAASASSSSASSSRALAAAHAGSAKSARSLRTG
jgi:hypothetical protein